MRNRLAIFLVSAIGLASELATVRLASFMLPSQYAYFVLAVAVLGGGLGSALVAKGRLRPGQALTAMLGLAFALGTAGMMLPWSGMVRPLAFLWFAGLPYVAVGAWMSSTFAAAQRNANTLYFFDLAGAAVGIGGGYVALQNAGPVPILILTAVAGIGLAGFAQSGRRLAAVIATLVVAALLATTASWAPVVAGVLTASGDKPVTTVRQLTGKPLWTAWNSFGRVDVMQLPDSDRMVVYTDGSAATEMLGYDSDAGPIAGLESDPGMLPFLFNPGAKSLLIGPGGGKDILMALQSGSQDVTAVELNPLIVKATSDMKAFSGDPYHLPGVTAVIGDGRAFVRTTDDSYDLVYLSLVMTGTAERTGWGLAENYIYTTEAVADYLDRLRPDGQLAFVLHEQSDLIKAISISLRALMARGESAQEAVGHLAVFVQMQSHSGTQHGRPVLVVGREPIDSVLAADMLAKATGSGASPVFIPGMTTTGSLSELAGGKLSYAGFVSAMARSGIDASASTDNRPYFYNTSTSSSWITMTLVAAAIIGAFILNYGLAGRRADEPLRLVAAASGFGYMAVEITLIQSLRLLINEPTLSVVGTLLPLLAASGTGSLLSGRLDAARRKRAVVWAAAIVAVCAAAYPLIIDLLVARLTGAALWQRVLVAAAAIGIPGLAMGFPFPYVLANARQPAESWTINGVTSVIGSVGAVLISMWLGLSYSLLAGALAYVAVAVVLHKERSTAPTRQKSLRSIALGKGT
ncbi:MAG: hypothetical protein ACM3XN_11125 [Chloroflexota bacterium]